MTKMEVLRLLESITIASDTKVLVYGYPLYKATLEVIYEEIELEKCAESEEQGR